jgi:hypothetical protein
MVTHVNLPIYAGNISGIITVQAREKNGKPYLKNNSSKKGLGEWLKWLSTYLAKHKTLSSNISTAK